MYVILYMHLMMWCYVNQWIWKQWQHIIRYMCKI